MDIIAFEASVSVDASYELSHLWRELTAGEVTVLSSGYSSSDCFLKLRRRAGSSVGVQPRTRSLEVLRRSLLGDSQKLVAIERQVAVSTVAMMCAHSLIAMGARQSPSRVPALLVLAAHAASGLELPAARLIRALDPALPEFIVLAERPDNSLENMLPQAEFAVARCLVEGLTHSQIAKLRGTSLRTVANQLASIFRKLRVTGRRELLCKLIRGSAGRAAAA